MILMYWTVHNGSRRDIDFGRLREDLMNEYGAQMVTFAGTMGYSDMCDVQNAFNEELLKMAQKENFNLN